MASSSTASPEVLTLVQAAKLLQVNPRTLATVAIRNRIGSKLGSRWRFLRDDVLTLATARAGAARAVRS